MRASLAWVWSILLCVACGGYQPEGDAWVDRRLSRFAYVGEEAGATLVVGTQAARYRENQKFMPVEIAVGNTSRVALRLRRTDFVLVDTAGIAYETVEPAVLVKEYNLLDMDRSALGVLPSQAASAFPGYRLTPSKFSPTRAATAGLFTRDVVHDEIVVPTGHYIVDFIYFPKPATGIEGRRFELVLSNAALEGSVRVSFVVD